MSRINKFIKEDMNIRVMFTEDGSMELNCYDIAYGLFLKVEHKNEKDYESIRWSRLEAYVENKSFAHYWSKETSELSWLPEGDFYKLIMKMRGMDNEKVNKFQDWVAFEVLPSLRKNNYYIDKENITDKQKEQIISNYSNILLHNKKKSQRLHTFLEQAFPDVEDVYSQFLKKMQESNMLDKDFKPTEKFVEHNNKVKMFTHSVNTSTDIEVFFTLTNNGMDELCKRLYVENRKLCIRKRDGSKELKLF